MSKSPSLTCFKERRLSCPLGRFNRRCRKLQTHLPNVSVAKAVIRCTPHQTGEAGCWNDFFSCYKRASDTALSCARFVRCVHLYTRFLNRACLWKATQEVMLPERLPECFFKDTETYCVGRRVSERGIKYWWPRYNQNTYCVIASLLKWSKKHGREQDLDLTDGEPRELRRPISC